MNKSENVNEWRGHMYIELNEISLHDHQFTLARDTTVTWSIFVPDISAIKDKQNIWKYFMFNMINTKQ